MKKMNSTLLFSRFGKPENFWKLLVKEEERRRRSSRRCSKRFKEYVEKLFVKVVKDCNNISQNASQGLAFIDSSSLVKKTIRRVITFRKTWKPLEELHL